MTTTFIASPVLGLDAASDVSLVGGKASGLHRLMQLDVAVPRGFVITAAATGAWPDDAIPDAVWTSILEGWRELTADVLVIVRSSAVGEDSRDASFAGQLDSFAGVSTERQLHQAVLACWRSRSADRVRAYERSRGRTLAGLAIIVQQQIRGVVSGVLFTQDPSGSSGALIE